MSNQSLITYKVKPDRNCKACHGSGEVFDYVPSPFGVGDTRMCILCECVYDNLTDQNPPDDESTFDIALDLSDFDPTHDLPVSYEP